MTFKTAMTFSVDTGNFLTLSPNAGNGLGITQTQGTASTLDVGETLHVSDVQITDIAFTGSVAGFTFSNPTITNFGTQVLRSGAGTDFTEASENAGLYSVPPGERNPTIGFGDGALGTGVVQSNVKIENGFDAAGTSFTPRYLGAWDFKMLAGSMGLKGIGFQYDLGYDIAAMPVRPWRLQPERPRRRRRLRPLGQGRPRRRWQRRHRGRPGGLRILACQLR